MLYQLSYLATRSALVQRSRGGPPGEAVIIPCGKEGKQYGEFASW